MKAWNPLIVITLWITCILLDIIDIWHSLVSHLVENHAFIKCILFLHFPLSFDIILKYNIEFKINTYIVGAPEHLGTRGIVQNKVWPKIQFSLFSHRFYLNVFREFVQWNFRTFQRPWHKVNENARLHWYFVTKIVLTYLRKNCSSDFKSFANSRPLALNFKSFSR